MRGAGFLFGGVYGLATNAAGGRGATLPGFARWAGHKRLCVAYFEADSGHDSPGGEGDKGYGQDHGQRPNTSPGV